MEHSLSSQATRTPPPRPGLRVCWSTCTVSVVLDMGEQDEAVFQVALVPGLLSEELATAKVSVLVVVARDEGCRGFEVVDVLFASPIARRIRGVRWKPWIGGG